MRRLHRLVRLLAVPGDWWQFGCTAANTRFNPTRRPSARATSAAWSSAPGACPTAQRWRFGTIGSGSSVVSGGRLSVSGGQDIVLVDQFRL
jgi:hypothetical protein